MSSNPYQKSTEHLTSKMPKLTREQALKEVRRPAIGLISISALNLGLALISIFATVIYQGLQLIEPSDGDVAYSAPKENESKQERELRIAREEKQKAEGNFISLSTVFVAAMTIILVNAIVLSGGIKMLHLQKHSHAVTAAAISIIPILSPLLIVGIPFGIWAMIKLGNPEVKRYFIN